VQVDQRESKDKMLLKMGQSMMPALQRTISLRFSAIQDITAGSEITTTYGTQNNDHLLLSYSFVLSPNVFDDFLVASGPEQVLDLFLQVQKRRDEEQGARKPREGRKRIPWSSSAKCCMASPLPCSGTTPGLTPGAGHHPQQPGDAGGEADVRGVGAAAGA